MQNFTIVGMEPDAPADNYPFTGFQIISMIFMSSVIICLGLLVCCLWLKIRDCLQCLLPFENCMIYTGFLTAGLSFIFVVFGKKIISK